MKKEEILIKSREENRNGDEYEMLKKKTASNNGYFVATYCFALLAISCYFGITNGNVNINGFKIELPVILWTILFLANLVEYGSKYAFLKQKKYLIYTIFWLCGLIAWLIVMFR